MLRRLAPYGIIILTVLLDTAILPAFYQGAYAISLTLAAVLCVGLTLGKLYGMLLGMIGGLLIDITTGTLGMMTFYCLTLGFLVALLLDETNPSTPRPKGIWFHVRHALTAFGLYMLGEIVLGVYHYFLTASFSGALVVRMLLRGAIFAVLVLALYTPLKRLFLGKKLQPRETYRKSREVKHF